jgi:hypothetical protein
MLAPGRSQRRVRAPGLQGQWHFMPGGERKSITTPLGRGGASRHCPRPWRRDDFPRSTRRLTLRSATEEKAPRPEDGEGVAGPAQRAQPYLGEGTALHVRSFTGCYVRGRGRGKRPQRAGAARPAVGFPILCQLEAQS